MTYAVYSMSDGKWWLLSWGHDADTAIRAADDYWNENDIQGVKVEPTPAAITAIMDDAEHANRERANA